MNNSKHFLIVHVVVDIRGSQFSRVEHHRMEFAIVAILEVRSVCMQESQLGMVKVHE